MHDFYTFLTVRLSGIHAPNTVQNNKYVFECHVKCALAVSLHRNYFHHKIKVGKKLSTYHRLRSKPLVVKVLE